MKIQFLRTDQINNIDFSLIKKTEILENTNVEFRADLLNAFNHVLFPGPVLGATTRGLRDNRPLDAGELFAACTVDLEAHLLRSILKTPRL